jgi:D-alanyl-lipoteichoic acid acyltransferase DltB (MBOAT superfamily)
LSSWLRDYLYIPLGGNRNGERQTHRNLLLTMLLGGLWHGAAWNFVVWGLYQGLLLIGHRILTRNGTLARLRPGWVSEPLAFAGKWFVMYHLTCYGWLVFRATSMDQIVDMSWKLLTPFQGFDPVMLSTLLLYCLPLVAIDWYQHRSGQRELPSFEWIPAELKAVSYATAVYLVVFRGAEAQAFIYFQF